MENHKNSIMIVQKEHGHTPTRDRQFEVTWEASDRQNPRTWPVWYRSFIVASMSFSTTVVYELPPFAI